MVKPWALVRAELVDGLCQRYHCLPSKLMAEDAHEILQILGILALARGDGLPSEERQKDEIKESDLDFQMRTLR